MLRLPPWLGSSLLVVFLLSACAEDASDPEPSCVLSAPCDILSARCQQEIFVATACALGQRGATMPAVRIIDREQFAEEARAEWSGDKGSPASFWRRSWPLFGLTARDETPMEAQIAERVSFVAAYYRNDESRVTLVRDALGADEIDDTLLLSHEFVHALQHQDGELDGLYEALGSNSDARDSLASLREGEASFAAILTLTRSFGRDVADIPWEQAFESRLETDLAELADATSPLLSAWRLVYPVGEHVVAEAYSSSGLGWHRRDLRPAASDLSRLGRRG